jgi:hypothetical protein
VVLAILIVLAGAEFVWRGPARALRAEAGFNDFLSPYVQSQAWVRGSDPYSPESLVRLWPPGATRFQFLAKELADGSLTAKRGIPTAYPLSCFVLLSPVALLPWPVANLAWVLINVSLFFAMLWALASYTGLSRDRTSTLAFIAGSLALAPFHTGISDGNPAVIATELSILALWMAETDREIATGVLLALSLGLKPQISLCFWVYFLLRRRWRALAAAAAIFCLAMAIGMLRLHYSHVAWLPNYVADNQALLSRGILGDFRPLNPTRFGLLNTQLVLYPLVGTARLANALAFTMGAILLVVWAWYAGRPGSQTNLLQLSTLAVISLLPVYHRFHDAVLLVMPLCWYSASFRSTRLYSKFGLLLFVPFLAPGGSLLETLRDTGRIPSSIAANWFWNEFVMPHAVWCLLFLAVLLLWEMRRPLGSPNLHSSQPWPKFARAHPAAQIMPQSVAGTRVGEGSGGPVHRQP